MDTVTDWKPEIGAKYILKTNGRWIGTSCPRNSAISATCIRIGSSWTWKDEKGHLFILFPHRMGVSYTLTPVLCKKSKTI